MKNINSKGFNFLVVCRNCLPVYGGGIKNVVEPKCVSNHRNDAL